MKSLESLPSEVVVNLEKPTKAVVLSPEIDQLVPEAAQAFQAVDDAYETDPKGYLKEIGSSIFSFESYTGAKITCSLLHGADNGNELLVLLAPFSDGAPTSTASEMLDFLSASNEGGLKKFIHKQKAGPNSWSQISKSAVQRDLLFALGHNMPVLTIFSPIPLAAYTSAERYSFSQGNYLPAGAIVEEAIQEAQKITHGSRSETRYSKIHVAGGSLGASNAIGAADHLVNQDVDVRTVTAQELILGPGLLETIKRFTIAGTTGEASTESANATYARIPEPAIRRELDGHGAELAMQTRIIKGFKPTYLRGFSNPDYIVDAIGRLTDTSSPHVIIGANSALTKQTAHYIDDESRLTRVFAENGQKAGHIINEHVALSSLMVALNILRRNRQ